MKSIRRQPIHPLRNEIQALAEACPLAPGDRDCPLYELRRMFSQARERWLNALPEDDLKFLVAYHQVCKKSSLEAQLPG